MFFFFFFFKQKTAYEMVSCDWSSDVCSSDLMVGRADLDVIKSQFFTKNRNTLLSDDADLDALLLKVASEPDPDKRIAASQAVQDYLAEQAYVIPFFEEPQVYGTAPYVHGAEYESVGRPL